MKNSFLNHRSSLGVPPEFFGATGVGNDAAALNLWLAADIFKRVGAEQFYSFSSALTIPNGTVIEGTLNLIWTGAGSVPVMTIGNDCEIQNLWISTPATTGNSMTIGTGYKGESLVASGFGNSGAGFLTIADTAGLDLDLLESTGGFQRAFTLGNDSAWSSGGRVGMLRVRDYTRGVGLNYLDGFRLEGYDIQGRNALASRSPGHNGILASGLRNCRFGAGAIEGAGEHLFRLAGSADRGSSFNNKFGHMTLDGPGGSFIKINADAIAHDFQFEGIDGVGRFASVPGGNSEFIRGTGCQNILFGPCRLVVGEGSAYSAQDALALNNVIKLSVQSLHVEGLGQSVVDFAGNQDIGGIIGNGDVRDITIGSLTGTDLTSRTMVRFALTSGFEASGLHISGVDYFSDGPLFAANGTTVVDGACSISGRFRKTDLTTLPATTNLPATIALDLEIGQRRVKNLGGALAWADLPTPWDFGAVGLADDTVALQAWASAIQGKTGCLPPDSHFRTTQEILLNSNGTAITGTGTIEQLTWGLSGIQVWGDDCTIDGPRIISTQTKTLISTALSQRYRGDNASARCAAVYIIGDNCTVKNAKQEGFVGGIKLTGRRVWRPNVTLSGGTTTTLVLNAADAQANDYYNGMPMRVLGGADSTEVTIVDYVAGTNTVTVTPAWSAAQNGSGRYYVIHTAPCRGAVLKGNKQERIDFGVTMTWADSIDVTGLHYTDGEVTQDPDAPPHALYVTGDSAALRTSNLSVTNVFADKCYGSAIKFRGVDGLTIGDVYVANARGIATLEQCIHVVADGLVGHDLGNYSNGRPTGVTVTGGLDNQLGNIVAHFSPLYTPGVAAVSYDPTALLVRSDVDGSGDYAVPEGITFGDLSARWETADSNGLTLMGLNVALITGSTASFAAKRVRGQSVSAVASGVVRAVRFVSAQNSEVMDAYALSLNAVTTEVARFDAGATNCRVYFDQAQNPAMAVVNSGTNCFTHQPIDQAPAILNHKYVIGLGADPTANADAINAAVAQYAAHGNGRMDLYFPIGTYEIGVPNAWKVGGAQEGSAVRLLTGGGLTFVGNGTVLVPATNEIEMFVQNGATNIGFHNIRFDNTDAGILQNTAKPASLTPYAGVPGLGNAANTAIRQYSGANLTVDDCEFYAFNTAIGYDGNRANSAVLVGDFVSRDVKTYGCAFGHLIEQPKTLTLTGGRCYDNVDSLNSSGSTLEDPGHLLYVTDRSGAPPEQIIVKDIMSFNGLSSALKIRKGECLTVSDFTAFNEGRGLELHLIQRGAVSNVSVKLKDTAETNQNAVELTDCGTVELSNMTLDLRGASAFGLRARTDLNSQPWHNRGWRMSNVTVINDYSGDTTKAPFIVQGQTYFEMFNMRFEHRGTTAGTRFPLDIRGCSNGTITNPTHIRPDGSPTDGHRLVSLDATCVNVAINLPAAGLSTTAALTGTASTAVLSVAAGATGTTVTGREAQGVTVALLGTVASTDRRAVVTDSTVAASGNFGAVVAGGGANRVPVYYDGTNWRIG